MGIKRGKAVKKCQKLSKLLMVAIFKRAILSERAKSERQRAKRAKSKRVNSHTEITPPPFKKSKARTMPSLIKQSKGKSPLHPFI